jgi:hypothetical protein
MTQSSHPARRDRPQAPKRPSDSTRPVSSRRECDRRPYPTAATTTRVSPAKPGSTSTRPQSPDSAATRTPATVWTAGPAAIDVDATWPSPIISTIVISFSNPAAQVVLLPWPTPQPASGVHRHLGLAGPRGVLDHAAEPNSDDEVRDALAAVESLDGNGRVVRIATEDNFADVASRPFWSGPIGDRDRAPVTASAPSPSGLDGVALDDPEVFPAGTDLIITSLRPEHGGDHASDVVALVAARLLRVGGTLVMLTHCDGSAGELIDRTGAVVASAQNADLLYLQHIVAVHLPVRDGRFATELLTDTHDSDTEERTRAAHRRIHSDVLVFAQPQEYEPPAEQAATTGVLR